MSRLNTIVIAVGADLPSPRIACRLPRVRNPGDALARAENICLEYGVEPSPVAFDTCVRPRGAGL